MKPENINKVESKVKNSAGKDKMSNSNSASKKKASNNQSSQEEEIRLNLQDKNTIDISEQGNQE
jgi:hypothetical protein